MKTSGRLLKNLLFAAVAALPAAAFPADAGKRLVGHWPFEEREGLRVEDVSGGGRAGEILSEGRGVKRVTGRTGGGLEFSGGDPGARGAAGCLTLPGLGALDWSRGMTVALWVRFTKLDRPATYELVSNAVSDRGTGFRFRLAYLSLSLASGEGGNGKTWGAGTNASLVPFRAGEWYHVAGTYDGARFRVYVDGALAGESEEKLPLTQGEPTLWIGAYRGGYAYGLDAVVDDLRLYSYARTPAEIMVDARLRD